ncbi:molybdopterin converting factor subunit 1 [Adhaeribacter arboris]|uniref:Molybdopterin synthase sulfur carrier subunit n=1 Tax=Adhaeribacter arboris TaxID=2072846 RepID=A0A2T2YM66_9BACT|nr:molybdopterin converting factor subunit 1 [Adhaeribacter arboris]PSR56601.1 molybdopterin converting factor subunit 1 [Adhaeribacter arboris]
MQLKIRLFGITKDIIGQAWTSVDIPESAKVEDLMQNLKITYPGLNKLHSVLVAVNDEYAKPEVILKPNDEIALIPPVSGG